ncbi:hypothetical protein DPMN_191959 [Dreissena polymorpha]|uniref:Uncharacterized protein n=1 Tax=Dreissena polymorpha TaxID=45954 RepID=A0A9D4BEF0_DREPO|nr:hypothetical protein DPMN_191959 [Dreissena polymorpha]
MGDSRGFCYALTAYCWMVLPTTRAIVGKTAINQAAMYSHEGRTNVPDVRVFPGCTNIQRHQRSLLISDQGEGEIP